MPTLKQQLHVPYKIVSTGTGNEVHSNVTPHPLVGMRFNGGGWELLVFQILFHQRTRSYMLGGWVEHRKLSTHMTKPPIKTCTIP